MGAVLTAGASLREPIDWHGINWSRVHRNVRRLQVRIVKAFRDGKPRLVRALQRILTRSLSGRALAVRRVTENQGKRTPGIDGELWKSPEQKTRGVRELREKGYRASPLRRIYIPKSNGKLRPLGIPVIRDRAMQALWKLAVDPIAESTGDPNSYGFREDRSTADAIEQVFKCLRWRGSALWILEGDITGCFDHIGHEWLLTNTPMDKQTLHQWLKAGFMEGKVFYPTEEGTPQGGIISPVLANLALDGLEAKLKARFPRKAQVHFIRYADDFIITAATKELLIHEVIALVKEHIRERGLSLSEEKTKITHIDEGFDFLGQNIRKYKGKLLIKPSRKNVHSFLDKVRGIIKDHPHTHPMDLIRKLNPVIRGWANYHRHVVSKETYGRVDSEITKALWKWARYRHTNKSKKWTKKRCFRVNEQGRDWCFFGRRNGREATLMHAVSVPIKRHTKIRGEANPYDPEWEIYFERRLETRIHQTLKGRGQVFSLWKNQKGKCPVCNQPITDQTGWHKHHLTWKVHGGGEQLCNLVLLHPNCHRQIHSHKLKVEKPGPSRGL